MTKLAEVGREIASGALIPVLGPDLLEGTSVPAGARALAWRSSASLSMMSKGSWTVKVKWRLLPCMPNGQVGRCQVASLRVSASISSGPMPA